MINFSENVEALEGVILSYILYKNDDYILSDAAGNHVEISKLLYALQPSFFTNRLYRDMIDQIKQFYKKYKSIPSKEELENQLEMKNIQYSKLEFNDIFNTSLFKYNNDFLYENLHAFLVVKTINSQFNKVSQHLALAKPDPDNIDNIFEYVRNELSNNLEVDITSEKDGLDVYDFHSHIQPKKDTVATGFGYLDLVLGGGWEPKTLVCFFGRPKIGKSLVISNLAVRCASLGSNVGVYSVELGDRKYIKRIGSNMFAIPFTYYNDYVDENSTVEVQKQIDDYRNANPNAGTLIVKEAPTGSQTVYDIENYFLKEEKKRNIHFDVVFVDYVNLLRDVGNETNMYMKIKKICEGLRKIAQRNNWCIVTATQANKQSFTNDDLQLDSVAESAGLVATVDTLIGLSSDSEEQLKMKTVANRDNGHMGSYAMYVKNFEFYRLEEDTRIPNGDDYMFNLDNTKDLLKKEIEKNYDISKASRWTPEKNTEFMVDGESVFNKTKNSVYAQADDYKTEVVQEQEAQHSDSETSQDDMIDFDLPENDPLLSSEVPYEEPQEEVHEVTIVVNNPVQSVEQTVVIEPIDNTVKEEPEHVTTHLAPPEPVAKPMTFMDLQKEKEKEKEEQVDPLEVQPFAYNDLPFENDIPILETQSEEKNVDDSNYSSGYLVNTFKTKEEHDNMVNLNPNNVTSVFDSINRSIVKKSET